MHGLILAGGVGSRLAADGVTEPKPLVRIDGQPQLRRLCDTLDALGCESVTCMVRAGVPAHDVVGESTRRRVVACATPSSLHTLRLGFDAVPPGPVFCTMVDTVMSWDHWLAVWRACQSALAHGATALLAVTHPPERDQNPLYVQVDETGRITTIGAMARESGRPESSLVTAGVYGFGPAVRPLAARAVGRGMHRMREFLTSLTRDGQRVETAYVERALDLDHRGDLDEANAWAPAVTP